MNKGKYIYNPNTLTYEKVKSGARKKFIFLGGAFIFLALLTTAIYLLSLDMMNATNQQKDLMEMHRHYKKMQSEIELMKNGLENLNERDAAISKQLMEIDPEEFSYINGGISRDSIKKLSDAQLITQISGNIAEMRKKISTISATKSEMEALVGEKEKMLKAIPSIRPIKKPDNGIEYLSGFGYRKHPVFKILKMHGGIDFSAEIGTPVYASGNGKVQQIIQKSDGLGKCIVIDHGYNFISLYAHLSEMDVRVGEEVKRGQIIGRAGNSGTVTPHLHYEVQYKRKRINPLHFCREGMNADEFNRFAEMVSKENQALSIHQ
jgi:murein DD-endopeptidase MepM/ murein hydrolase activator NlpD